VGRAELLKLLGEVRSIDHFEADRFIGGHPLRILSRTDEPAAKALAEKLRAMGALVMVEPSPPEFAMPSDISLMSLDGDEGPAAELAPAAPKPEPLKPAPDEGRFNAPPIAETVMELEAAPVVVARAPAPAEPTLPPPPPARQAPLPEQQPFEPEESSVVVVPGRLMQGQLRRQPGLRLAIGVALGLLLGYALSAPYQTRAERRVAQIRAQANADRYRPVDEARANAARLDEEADDLASSAFAVTLAIWLGAAGAITAAWYRLT
jgi:hypothetical protein